MRRSLIAGFLIAGTMTAALAMQQSNIPAKFGIPWGNSAGSSYIRTIPTPSQIGIQNCAASLTDGFPPLTFTPPAAGCPPFGQDFNGILKQITQWNQWQAAGNPVQYDSAFSASIGGYPKGAILQSGVLFGRVWISTADNNTTNPDATTAANWSVPLGMNPAGTPVASLSATVPPGYVAANGLTVGNASSNATNRANADTFWLFSYIWNNCPATLCILYNSTGTQVSRGANATADWNANDAIATYNMNGAALMGADSMGTSTSTNLVNVPVTAGSRTQVGSTLGENLHTLLVAELAQHTHTDPGHLHTFTYATASIQQGTGALGTFVTQIAQSGLTAINTQNTSVSLSNTGSNTPHNTVPRSIITYWNLTL